MFRPSESSAVLGGQSIWHFRAIPDDVQRCTVRRLMLCGLSEAEIAARTGLPVERIRQVMREESDFLFAASRAGFKPARARLHGS